MSEESRTVCAPRGTERSCRGWEQEAALRKKLGCDKVDFRVVVESGKVKLKASAGGRG